MEISSNTLCILTNGTVSSEGEVIGLTFLNGADSGFVVMQKSQKMWLNPFGK